MTLRDLRVSFCGIEVKISAVVIRADGSIEDLGVISSKRLR